MTNDVYKKKDTVYSAEINGRTVVLNMETGQFYHLDGTGCLIWQLLETPLTASEVAEGVSDKCQVPVSECLRTLTPSWILFAQIILLQK